MAALLLAMPAGCGGSQASSKETTVSPDQPNADVTAAGPRALPAIEVPNARMAHGYMTGGALTLEQVALAKDKGYTRIIDVRGIDEEGVAEERAKAEEIGISYVSLPISGAEDLTMQNIQAFGDLLARDDGPTIVHCKSGNRVGALFALRAYFIDKKPAEEALQIGRDLGLTKLEDHVRGMLDL